MPVRPGRSRRLPGLGRRLGRGRGGAAARLSRRRAARRARDRRRAALAGRAERRPSGAGRAGPRTGRGRSCSPRRSVRRARPRPAIGMPGGEARRETGGERVAGAVLVHRGPGSGCASHVPLPASPSQRPPCRAERGDDRPRRRVELGRVELLPGSWPECTSTSTATPASRSACVGARRGDDHARAPRRAQRGGVAAGEVDAVDVVEQPPTAAGPRRAARAGRRGS